MDIPGSLWYGVSLQEARTMRNTLEDLYYGNIAPNTQDMVSNSELKRATDRVARFEKQLTEQLDESDRRFWQNSSNRSKRLTASPPWKISFWASGWALGSWQNAWMTMMATSNTEVSNYG